MSVKRLQLVPARTGQPTVEVDGTAYHSPYDPVREVEKFYARFPLEEADVVLHFGWGLGYCREVLEARTKPGARIVVFEPDEELFQLSLQSRGSSRSSAIEFVVGEKVCRFFDEWPLGHCQETDRILWIEWPAALRGNPALAETLKAGFKRHLRDRAANLLTHFRNGENYFENVIRNFQYQSDPDAGRLFGLFPGAPLVIVSAGPSLDRNIAELRGCEDRCFILSVDTALRPLLAAGVVPHAVLIADPSELNAQHIAGVVPSSTFVIAEQAVHASALEGASKRFLFGLGLFPDPLFAKYGFGKARLDAWGSVATIALDLACRMGASPVIFAGQDFAYSWNRDYASHTIYHGNHFDVLESGKARTADIFGNEAYTTENLIAYRDFFIRRMKQSPKTRFINATEGGILTGGAEILPLREALGRHARRPLDTAARLGSRHRPAHASETALEHLRGVLESRSRGCGCLDGFLELVAKEQLLSGDEAGMDAKIHRALAGLAGRK